MAEYQAHHDRIYIEECERFFNISHDLFCILNPAGYYLKVNPALRTLLGYSDEELRAHPFTWFVHPDDVPAVLNEYAEAARGKHNKVVENRFRSKDGHYHWISWSTIVQDEKGIYYSSGQNITTQKKLQAVLQKEQQENQKKITTAIIQAQERERSHLGRELHDNINQILYTVKLFLELCKDKTADVQKLLDRAIQLQGEAIDEIRDLSHRLSAPSLADDNLAVSIKELVDAIAGTRQVHVTLDSAPIEELQVEPVVHLTVYRILQEHLTNILKHAGAQHVAILLDFVEGTLVVEVKDNGQGFNPEYKSSGAGIQNMRSRAESLNGSISVSSMPGNGTVLTARFPLLPEEGEQAPIAT